MNYLGKVRIKNFEDGEYKIPSKKWIIEQNTSKKLQDWLESQAGGYQNVDIPKDNLSAISVADFMIWGGLKESTVLLPNGDVLFSGSDSDIAGTVVCEWNAIETPPEPIVSFKENGKDKYRFQSES